MLNNLDSTFSGVRSPIRPGITANTPLVSMLPSWVTKSDYDGHTQHREISRLLDFISEQEFTHQRDLLSAIRQTMSGTQLESRQTGMLIESGAVLALAQIEMNEAILPSSANQLMSHKDACCASSVLRKFLLTEANELRMDAVAALMAVDYKLEVNSAPRMSTYRSLHVITCKGPLYVCGLSILTGFTH